MQHYYEALRANLAKRWTSNMVGAKLQHDSKGLLQKHFVFYLVNTTQGKAFRVQAGMCFARVLQARNNVLPSVLCHGLSWELTYWCQVIATFVAPC